MTNITINEFVNREILLCVSCMIYELTKTHKCPSCQQVHTVIPEEEYYQLWTGSIDWEEAEREMLSQSGYILIQHSDGQWGLQNPKDNNWMYFPTYDTKQEVIEDYFDYDLDTFRSEVYEHHVVSCWLADRLEEHGETVVEMFNLQIWCRSTTGQIISADWVIQQIYNELITT